MPPGIAPAANPGANPDPTGADLPSHAQSTRPSVADAIAVDAANAGNTANAAPRAVRTRDLTRSLVLRISLFALALTLLADGVIVLQARDHARANIERAGRSIEQLIADAGARNDGLFHIAPEAPDLARLDGLGALVHVCVRADNLWGSTLAVRCIGADSSTRAPDWLVRTIGALIGDGVEHRGNLRQPTGIKNGELRVLPDIDAEAADAWRAMGRVLWMTLAILAVNALIYGSVRRALAPSAHILVAVEALERGRLDHRLPRFELAELDRIAAGFNHLAARLQQTLAAQRELAARLLSVREEERRSLARELHDELGQALTSINAEAAFAAEIARDELPALLPCAEAIARTTGATMDAVQRIVRGLRPPELEFGLAAALGQLVETHVARDRERRRTHGDEPVANAPAGAEIPAAPRLTVTGDFSALDDGVAASLYRVAQECLTNIARHGGHCVRLSLARGAGITLVVEDDGPGLADDGAESCTPSRASPKCPAANPAPPPRRGYGRIGMAERMAALGGSLRFEPRQPRGLRVIAELPADHSADKPAP